VLRPVRFEQLGESISAGEPGLLGRDARGVEAVEVAPGGQALGVPDRVAAVLGVDEAAVERLEQTGVLAGCRKCAKVGAPLAQQRVFVRRRLGRKRAGEQAVGGRLGQRLVVLHEQLVRLGQAEACVQAFAEHLHHRADAMLEARRLAEGVQAERLCGLRQRVQPVVQLTLEGAKVCACALGRPADVLDQGQACRLIDDGAHGAILDCADVEQFVFVQQVVQRHQLRMQTGRCERWRLVADDGRPATPLRLGGLADVVDDVGIDHRQVAQHQVGVVMDRQAALLARRPLLAAVGAEVDQRVGIEGGARIEVGGKVEVGQRHLGVVVDRLLGRLVDAAARRLRHDHQVTKLQARDREAARVTRTDQHRVVLGRSPVLVDALADLRRQAIEPGKIVGKGQGCREVVGQQGVEPALAVERCEQTGRAVDERLFLGGRHGIARAPQGLGQAGETARYVQERGRQVLATNRTVRCCSK